MASAQIFTDGNFQGVGTDGLVVPNGKLYIYDNATGLLATTYQDSAQTITNVNPVILSASGKAKVFLAAGTYDITLKTSAEVTVWTLNDYIADDVYSKAEADAILSARTVGTIAALRTTVYSGQPFVSVTGYDTALDNIGVREFNWDATSTEADNGGTIIQVTGVVTGRWKLKTSGSVNVDVFGVSGTLPTNTSRFQNAVNSCSEIDCFGDFTIFPITIATPCKINIHGKITAGAPTAKLFYITSSDVEITGGKIDANSTCSTSIIDILGTGTATKLSNVKVKNVEMYGATGKAITFKWVDKLDVLDNDIHDCALTGIFNAETLFGGSQYIKINNNRIVNIGVGGASTAHGIAVNSWNSVFNLEVNNNTVTNTRDNGIELWANKVMVNENTVLDAVISISMGACSFAIISDNIVDVTTPATTGKGAYGIELGGCRYSKISGNTITGHRKGIQTTSASVTGADSSLFNLTFDDVKDWGKYSATAWSATQYRTTAGLFSGSPYSTISGNTILNSLDAGIIASGNFGENEYVINDNLIDNVGNYGTPTEAFAGIYVVNTSASISGNTISNSLNYGISASNGKIKLGANTYVNCLSRAVTHTGIGSSIDVLAKQSVINSPLFDLSTATTFTQGSFEVGQQVLFNDAAAGGFAGKICTTAGSLGTQLNTRTATTTSGSAVITVSAAGDFFLGVYITIAGVTGIKKIIGYNPTTLQVTLNSVCDASVVGGAIASSAPVFKTFGPISA